MLCLEVRVEVSSIQWTPVDIRIFIKLEGANSYLFVTIGLQM